MSALITNHFFFLLKIWYFSLLDSSDLWTESYGSRDPTVASHWSKQNTDLWAGQASLSNWLLGEHAECKQGVQEKQDVFQGVQEKQEIFQNVDVSNGLNAMFYFIFEAIVGAFAKPSSMTGNLGFAVRGEAAKSTLACSGRLWLGYNVNTVGV